MDLFFLNLNEAPKVMNDKMNATNDIISVQMHFRTDDKIILTSWIIGEIGLIVDINHKVPNGYRLADSEQSFYVLDPILSKGVFVKLVDIKQNHSKPINSFHNNANFSKSADQNIGCPARNKMIQNTVYFVTKSEQIVAKTNISGAAGWKVDISAPKGYQLVSHYWNFVVISPEELNQKIYVEPNGQPQGQKNNYSVLTNFKKVDGYITTFSKNSSLPVFNSKLETIYTIGNFYDYRVIGSAFNNNVRYLQIAEDAWIEAVNVFECQPIDIKIKTNANLSAPLYDCLGQVISRRTLEANTVWFTDRVIYHNGMSYYRVTETYWLKGSDVHQI